MTNRSEWTGGMWPAEWTGEWTGDTEMSMRPEGGVTVLGAAFTGVSVTVMIQGSPAVVVAAFTPAANEPRPRADLTSVVDAIVQIRSDCVASGSRTTLTSVVDAIVAAGSRVRGGASGLRSGIGWHVGAMSSAAAGAAAVSTADPSIGFSGAADRGAEIESRVGAAVESVSSWGARSGAAVEAESRVDISFSWGSAAEEPGIEEHEDRHIRPLESR